jgi:hypothetical protein
MNNKVSLKHSPAYEQDKIIYSKYLEKASGDEKIEFEKKLKRFYQLVDELDESFSKLSSVSLTYQFHNEKKNELLNYKRYLDSKTKRIRDSLSH